MTPPVPAAGFEVRFRERRGRPWRVLATAPTRDDATARMFDLMATRKGGCWHVCPASMAGGHRRR